MSDAALEAAIDACVFGSGLEYDIARAGAIILKEAGFVYEEATDEPGHKRGRWITPDGIHDKKLIHVKHAYRTRVVNAFLSRSIYWNNQTTEDRFDAQYKCMTLSQICLRITREQFLKRVIMETQNFYH